MKKKIIIAVIICACSLLGVAFIGNGGLSGYKAPNITVSDLQEYDGNAGSIVEVKNLNSLKRTLVLYKNSENTSLCVMGFSGNEYSFVDYMGNSYLKLHEEIVDDKKVMMVYGINPNSQVSYVTYTIDGKEEQLNVGSGSYVFETVIGDSTQDILFDAAYSADNTKLFRF